MKWWGHPNRIEDIKLVQITDWNRVGIRTRDDQRIEGEMK